MAQNQAQRARNKAAKEARRKAIVKQKKKEEIVAATPAHQIAAAAACPIFKCLVMPALFEVGIGQLILARQLPSGLLGIAFFLIDPYCLGVKDAFYREVGWEEAEERLWGLGEFVDYDPVCARRLVTEAAAYAADLGIPPPADLKVIERLFGDIDGSTCQQVFTFGKDGKPFFVAGPNDGPVKIRRILNALERKVGPGGFDYLLPADLNSLAGVDDLIELEDGTDEDEEDEQLPP